MDSAHISLKLRSVPSETGLVGSALPAQNLVGGDSAEWRADRPDRAVNDGSAGMSLSAKVQAEREALHLAYLRLHELVCL